MSGSEQKARSRHVWLVDGSGYIFRAFFALPPMSRKDGTPVNAVFGFTNMILKLVDDALADDDVDSMAVFFDTSRVTFRNEIWPDYKGNRPDTPEELIPQFSLIRDVTRAFGLPCLEMDGFEADDLIATYVREAREAGAQVTIVSSDKDLMQLVGEGVGMFDPMKNRHISPAEVREKFGVGPERVIDVQALAGDSSDNVPGVPGIGIKTAAQLIAEYGDLDSLLDRVAEIRQPKRRQNLTEFADQARVSRRLVTLRDDVPVTEEISGFDLKRPDPDVLLPFLREQGFTRTVARIEARFRDGAAGDHDSPADGGVERRYEAVQSLESLRSWVAAARAAGVVAVDTETTSLDSMRAELVGVSLAVAPGRACYIPLGHRNPSGDTLDLEGDGEPEQIPFDDAMAALAPLLADPSVLKVGQNIKYDMQVFRRYGLTVRPFDDTMLLSWVQEAGLHGHGLDELAELYLGETTIKFADVAGSGRKQVTFDRVPLDRAVEYAAEDADITLRLWLLLRPRLLAARLVNVYETLERPLVPVIADMERAGIRVDRAELERLSASFAERIDALASEVYGLAGHDFTIGSPQQLATVLFDEMGLESGRVGKSGARSTGADVLEGLAAQGHDLPARVLDWRQLSKLKGTYTDALVGQINPDTGRVHTSFAMAGTSTGRLASSDPNLQNIPVRTEDGRLIRRAFVPAGGCRLLSLDYSQIELRLLAHVAGIDTLREAFREGLDIHAMTASEVFGVPVEGMDPMIRRKAKAINFGIIYGISAFGLANQLGISRGEASDYINTYFARFPGIRDYMDAARAEARSRGYVTTPFGRRCHMPGINDRNQARRGFYERAAINAPLQGGAADIIKRAMIRVRAALEQADLSAVMLLQVHDELLFDVPEAEIDDTVGVLREVMEGAARPVLDLAVPLVVDAGSGPSWAEAH